MSESAPNRDHETISVDATPGELLRQLREKKSLTIGDVARGTRLEVRVIEALENDQFEGFPSSAFVKGYIRSIAKTLEIDPSAILTAYDAENAHSEPLISDFESRPPQQVTSASTLIRWTSALIVFAIIALLVLWQRDFLLQQHTESDFDFPEVVDIEPYPDRGEPLAYSYPVIEHGDAAIELPLTMAPATEARAQSDEAMPSTEQQGEGQRENKDLTASTAATVQEAKSELVISASAEAWVEVKDASGKRLYFGMVQPQKPAMLQGQVPYNLVIGNARSVNVQFRGTPVDLRPHRNRDVARLQVGGAPAQATPTSRP